MLNNNLIIDISIDNLMEKVKKISGWQRYSGSDEELEAFKYLKNILDNIGYETKLIMHDAYISIPISSTLYVGGVQIYSQTHSMSPSTISSGIEAYGLYVGDFKNDIEEGTLNGKIAVIEGRAGFEQVDKAYTSGAIGVVFISDGVIRESIVSNAWGSPTQYTKKFIPKIPVVSVTNESGEKIKDTLQKNIVIINMATTVDTRWTKIPSLTAEINAPVKTDKYVMFTGHLDSWYYGAIDNGTVNAAQVEVARIVAENKDKILRNFKVVFFSGHSHGRYAGSAWYSDEYWEDIHNNCIINVNADSIGGKNAVDITRSIIMVEAKDIAVEIIKEITNVDFVGTRCKKVADQSFWNAGVTSAFASFSKQPLFLQSDGNLKVEKGNAELGWWWHTPGDTLENIDADNFKRDTLIFATYILQFLTREIIPLNFVKTAEEINLSIIKWKEKAEGKFDLSSSVEKIQKLLILCKKLYNTKIIDKYAFNKTIFKLGRFLVPLNYTTGNIYENDPACDLPAVPSLALINKLIELDEFCDEAMETRVELMHKRNFVNDSLNKSIELIENYFYVFGSSGSI